MIVFFYIGLCLTCAAFLFVGIRAPYFQNRLTNGFIVLGLVCGLLFSLTQLFEAGSPISYTVVHTPNYGDFIIRFDKLSLFFMALIQLGGIVNAFYGIGYLSHYEDKRSLRLTLSATIALLISMQLLLISHHALMFLLFWELMALSGYFAIILERENPEVRKGSLIFFVVTHFGTLFLYVMFMLLHTQTGSWNFQDFGSSRYDPTVAVVIFWLGFVGFGMKAGFMPFHFWLPEAHPVAPSHISAILSGVMLKTGVYGLIRLITWATPLDVREPSLVLILSVITAVLGIWYAIAQKDIKRMLAYSSVENIGIIGISFSLMMFRILYQKPYLTLIGLGGTLLHSFNHMLFKSLLFQGAGVIYHYYRHRNIERMGGLIKRGPFFGSLFLNASVAICALPPLNGFVSEFIIYSGFFEAARLITGYSSFFMLLAAVMLALVGGVAVAGFTKLFSTIFLGMERAPTRRLLHLSVWEKISLTTLAMLCLVIGIFPQPALYAVQEVYGDLFGEGADWGPAAYYVGRVASISAGVVILAILLGLLKLRWSRVHFSRVAKAWGCGYHGISQRMQYSGSSYVDSIAAIADKPLNVQRKVSAPNQIFPGQGFLETHSLDFMLHRILIPTSRILGFAANLFKWLQSGKIQVYVTFSIIILAIYIILGFHS